MQLTIIREDGNVHENGEGYIRLDLSFIPANVIALQWKDTQGEVEYTDKPNEIITVLPDWALTAIQVKDDLTAQREADDLAAYNSPEGKKERIAQKRWEVETGGIVLNNMEIDTSRQSQALLTGAVTAAQIDPTITVKWKLGNGSIVMDKAQLEAVAMSVRNHIQACFDREIELIEAVDAGTYTEAMLEQGW